MVQINGKKSELGNVTCGIPQESVLGPLLFIIYYIKDLETEISNDISKFADDTKIGRPKKNIDDARMLQDNLNRLYEWSEKWQIQFNVNTCSIMSLGKVNRPIDYLFNDTTLGKSYSVRDLRVQVSSDLRPREQCIIARNKANKILGFISKCVRNKSEVVLKLYLALVRPHLDYATQFWSPLL